MAPNTVGPVVPDTIGAFDVGEGSRGDNTAVRVKAEENLYNASVKPE